MYNKVELCGVDTAGLPVLSEAEKRALLTAARAGDRAARRRMIEGNLRLVLSVVQKFSQRGENLDDLFQVGCIGLIKAIDHFDPALEVRFSTYGVPMIVGEIRRFLRDNNAVRVSRSMRDTAYRAMQAREQLEKSLETMEIYAPIANRLGILNVKEEIPFLSVKTVDNVTYTESIACPVVEVEDDTMFQGESKVLDEGVPGEQVVNANVAYLNGVEQERTVLSTQVTREATEKVIAVGTKVRPSWYPTGSYIWPVYGTITSSFGYRSIFGSYSYNSGLDIATAYGTTIKASDGVALSQLKVHNAFQLGAAGEHQAHPRLCYSGNIKAAM